MQPNVVVVLVCPFFTQEPGLRADDRNGEKLLLVSHPKLDMDTILAFTSLWWFTDTYPSSIYPYRQVSTLSLCLPLPISLLLPQSSHYGLRSLANEDEADKQFMGAKMGEPKPKPTKPFGYSHFPHDLGAAPIKWVEKEVNLVWSREHKDVRSNTSLALTYREDTFLSLSILLILGRVWKILLIKLGSSLHDFDISQTLVVFRNDTMHAILLNDTNGIMSECDVNQPSRRSTPAYSPRPPTSSTRKDSKG